jgi:hypothetical protein
MKREDDGPGLLSEDAEVPPIGGVAGQRDHRLGIDVLLRKVLLEARLHG